MNRPHQKAGSYGYTSGTDGVAPVAKSAAVMVPLICERFAPASVLDVGCGTGDWLRAFSDHGVCRVLGCDGPWVPLAGLRIPRESFWAADFYEPFPSLGWFDLACCLEVAEHVAPEVAQRIIELLCQSADLILFSAAVPGQGGYEHINERYQEFWMREFATRGFSAHDVLRPLIWMREEVSWWYQQNCLLFANEAGRRKHGLVEAPILTSLIHPALYEENRDPRNYSLKTILAHVPHYLRRALAARLPGPWRIHPA